MTDKVARARRDRRSGPRSAGGEPDATALHARIAAAPPVHDRERAARALDELTTRAQGSDALEPLARLLATGGKTAELLLAVFGASPFLTGLSLRAPDILRDCLTRDPDRHLDELVSALADEVDAAPSQDAAMRGLRGFKTRVALLTALADIGGVWDVERVTQALSEAADGALRAAVRFLLAHAARAGDYMPCDPAAPETGSGIFVLAMGKLGARELNYSSDIDLIVFYDSDRCALRSGLEPAPFFIRMTRDLVRLLQERTGEGYVFRVDLRLRPDPGASHVALSTEAGLTYYESFGQNWERAALIKARVAAGDIAAGEAFLAQLAPFVWRKYLDFAAIADIHAMKRRVHRFKGHAHIAVAGHNIKLGRGGIREIEFFVQTQQLIAGGRQPDLRGRKTLETLAQLVARGWIDQQAADELGAAYRFLRHVEHRLQMIADEQTHNLPERAADLERVARFCGFDSADAFAAALVGHMEAVQHHYGALFEQLPEAPEDSHELAFRGGDDDPATASTLARMGFTNAEAVFNAVRAWRSGRYAATRSERARERIMEVLPLLLEALAATRQPNLALASFDRFLSELPAGVQLFSMLRANPSLLRLIADIMGTAPRLAQVLSRRPRVLDAVLDPGFFGTLPAPEELEALIDREVAAAPHYEECLDRARVIGQEQAFLIGVRVLSGTITADQAGGAYAALAEHFIAALQGQVERELERVHGKVPGGRAAVLAMGKLGGREMTAGSDLDLIVVYDLDASAPSGPKALSGSQYYARLTQRLISALSAPTAEGALYQVDMRLRPSGMAGPVATQLVSFVDYQHRQAWTWEHLALTRARVVSGPPDLRRTIENVITGVLSRPRDRAKVAADVRDMRARIAKEKGSDDIWDLKQAQGGLVDLEFIAQFLQIVSAHDHPGVLDQNTGASLRKLADAGALSSADVDLLMPADRLYQNLTQVMRLCLDKSFGPEEAPQGLRDLLARAADMPDFAALEQALRETQGAVRDAFDRLVR